MALPPTASGVHVLPTVLRARQVLPRVRNKLARHRLRVIENFRPTRSKRAYLRQKDYDRGSSKSEDRAPDLHEDARVLQAVTRVAPVSSGY